MVNKERRRRSRRINANGQIRRYFPYAYRLQIWHDQKGRCAYCGCYLLELAEGRAAQDHQYLTDSRCPILDHRIPVIRGGSNKRDNLAMVCRRCDADKGLFTFNEWLNGDCLVCGLHFKHDQHRGRAMLHHLKDEHPAEFFHLKDKGELP